MSRTQTKESHGRLAAFRPLEAPRGLAQELVQRLTADITSGKLKPGARLPTEQEMIAATGVSRTEKPPGPFLPDSRRRIS